MTKQEFEEKYINGKKAVHCDTEEKAIQFLKLACYLGFGNKCNTNDSKWEDCGENTCYCFYDWSTGVYESVNYFKDNGYIIVEFDIKADESNIISERYSKLAELLGVKLDEEFLIANRVGVCKITHEGLYSDFQGNGKFLLIDCTLDFIMKNEITKLPLKPQYGDVYYYPAFHCVDRQWDNRKWSNSEVDERILKLFGCYRTKEEATNKAKELWGI